MIYRTETFRDGVAVDVEEWDTTAATYKRTVDGAVTETRAMTASEVASFAARAVQETAATNRATLSVEITTNVAALLAAVAALNEIISRTNATINANAAVAIKDVAREAKTVARQAIRIGRVVSGSTESTDSGT